MKIREVPDAAMTAAPTPVPTKMVEVFDWPALYETMCKIGFIVIESDQIRTTRHGAEECVPVKSFNSWVASRGIRLKTCRISKTRWFCTI